MWNFHGRNRDCPNNPAILICSKPLNKLSSKLKAYNYNSDHLKLDFLKKICTCPVQMEIFKHYTSSRRNQLCISVNVNFTGTIGGLEIIRTHWFKLSTVPIFRKLKLPNLSYVLYQNDDFSFTSSWKVSLLFYPGTFLFFIKTDIWKKMVYQTSILLKYR